MSRKVANGYIKRDKKRHTFNFTAKTMKFLRMCNYLDKHNKTRSFNGQSTKKSFNEWVNTVVHNAALEELGSSRDEQVLNMLSEELKDVELEMEYLHEKKLALKSRIRRLTEHVKTITDLQALSSDNQAGNVES